MVSLSVATLDGTVISELHADVDWTGHHVKEALRRVAGTCSCKIRLLLENIELANTAKLADCLPAGESPICVTLVRSAADLDKALGAAELRDRGFCVKCVKATGFADRQLREAGFSCCDLRDMGLTLKKLRRAGFSATECRNAGFELGELRELVSNAVELRKAGYDASQFWEAGFSLMEMKRTGFRLVELRDAGFDLVQFAVLSGTVPFAFAATEVREAGFELDQLREAGFSAEFLFRRADFELKQLHQAGFTFRQLAKAIGGHVPYEVVVAKLREEECHFGAQELRSAGFGLRGLQKLGFSETELEDAGFTLEAQRVAAWEARL